jgi:hypothetical protein
MRDDEKSGQSRFAKLVARTMRDMPKAPPRAIEAVAEFGRRRVARREVRTFTDEQRLLAILMPPLECGPGRRPIPASEPLPARAALESEPIDGLDESVSEDRARR